MVRRSTVSHENHFVREDDTEHLQDSLHPSKPQQTVDGSAGAEHKRDKPEGVDGNVESGFCDVVGELEHCRRYSREERRHGRLIDQDGD